MNWTKATLREIYGLFVDGGRFALAVVIWLAIAWFALPGLAQGRSWASILLFLGLAVILIESVGRRARK